MSLLQRNFRLVPCPPVRRMARRPASLDGKLSLSAAFERRTERRCRRTTPLARFSTTHHRVPPSVCLWEQVSSKTWKGVVRRCTKLTLSTVGYACGAADISAASRVGAPHIRQRLYWVAESQSIERHGSGNPWRRRDGLADHGATVRLAQSVGEQTVAAATGRLHAEPGECGTTDRLADADRAGFRADGTILRKFSRVARSHQVQRGAWNNFAAESLRDGLGNSSGQRRRGTRTGNPERALDKKSRLERPSDFLSRAGRRSMAGTPDFQTGSNEA